MMRLFRKNKEIQISPKYYLLVQDKWAKKMSSLTSNLSRKSLVFYLTLFVIITGSINIYNVYDGFSSKEREGIERRINYNHLIVTKPKFNKADERVLPKAEFENITRFNFYLDSLKQSKKGQKVFDSINNYRPRLLDSLEFMTNYYKTNFKK